MATERTAAGSSTPSQQMSDLEHRRGENDTVYVAVGKDVKESKLTLLWTLQNFPGKRICLLHVHQPTSLIGGNFPASKLEQYELREVQELERKNVLKIMDDYLLICHEAQVNAEKLYFEMDDTGKGIVELVYQHAIKKLVLVAAANKHHSDGMTDLESKKAKYVRQHAPLSCQLWFICNGSLIQTRADDFTFSSAETSTDSASVTQEGTTASRTELELCEVNLSEQESHLRTAEASEGSNIDELYGQLGRAMEEAEKFKREAFEESLKREKAEKTAIKALCSVKELESLYTMELRHRKETEEALSREKECHQRMKEQLDDERAMNQKLLIQSASYDSKIKELENEILSVVEQCIESMRERDALQVERDNALKLAEELANNQAEDSSSMPMVSSKKAQANWYGKQLEAEDNLGLVLQTIGDVDMFEGLLAFSDPPLPHTLVEASTGVPTSMPERVMFEMQTLPVDAKAVADGDTISVYVSTADPRESSCVPGDVHMAAIQRAEARADRNYEIADALHKIITDAGYRVINVQNEEILARKYRIRLRGIDAPEGQMPYGEEAKEELAQLVQGKCLRIFVYGEDRYGRSVGDVYCDGIFIQELMLKKGAAWHYTAYDQRWELASWEKEARAKRVGLWASSNPEKPWDWRKDRREGR